MYEITRGVDGKLYCRLSGTEVSAVWVETRLPLAVNTMINRARRWNNQRITKQDITFTREVLQPKVVITKRAWKV
jgi:hypothetical protein